MPNDEGIPKSHSRRQDTRPGGSRFDIRISSFFRHSSFGFGHCPEPALVGCYDFMNDLKFAFRQLLKNHLAEAKRRSFMSLAICDCRFPIEFAAAACWLQTTNRKSKTSA